MLTADKLERLRPATIDDAGGILRLIEPLEADGTLVFRGRELLEREIQRFFVLEHDGMIVGCAALYPFPSGKAAELAALAFARVAPTGRKKLVRHLSAQAKQCGFRKLFGTTRATHWFISAVAEPRVCASANQALALQLTAALKVLVKAL
jgi:amino-acid N-acetyltransferase